jgi:hypothetical protein
VKDHPLGYRGVGVGALGALLLFCALALTASARANTNCSHFRIRPSNRVDHVWVVSADTDTVQVSSNGKSPKDIKLYYAGIETDLGSPGPGSTTVNVKDIAKYGVGLYIVTWGDGCSAEIRLAGSGAVPWIHTPAGWASTTALVVALAGLALMFSWSVTITNPEAQWSVDVTGEGKIKRDSQGRPRVKFSYTATQTLIGTLFGLILGGASFVLLQQTALTPPTLKVAFVVTVPLTVVGALIGLRRGRPKVSASPGAAVPSLSP